MSKPNRKQEIIDALKEKISEHMKNKDTWKIRAYRNVLKQLNEKTTISEEKDLDNISGIGDSIKKTICSVLTTEFVPQPVAPVDLAIENLTKIHGIGVVKARDLFETHGVSTVEDLKNKRHLLNAKQLIGLEYEKDLNCRIPRKEIDKHKDTITKSIMEIDKSLRVEFVGSYRRGTSDSKDIDILICHPTNSTEKLLDTIVKKLTEIGYVKEVLAVGDKKFFGIAKVKYGRHFRRIDIMVTPKEEFPFAVMYFTGSKEFNVDLRNHCLKLGYSLNEYRLTNKKDKNPIDRKLESEEEIFDFLGFKFVPPFERKANILKFYKK